MRVFCRRSNLILLLILLASVAAFASPAGNETFTVLIRQDGSYLAGNSYSGSFAWNSAGMLTAFNFNFPGWTDNVADNNCSNVVTIPGVDVCYIPGPIGYSYAFAFYGSSSPDTIFRYGSTLVPNYNFTPAGTGDVTWGTPNYIPGVPEPGSLLMFGSGVIGFAGLLRRRLLSR